MSQNLTQPEEIDHIRWQWRHDIAGTPIPAGAYWNGAIHDFDEPIGVAVFHMAWRIRIGAWLVRPITI